MFEKFVLKFYARELEGYDARSHRIRWNAQGHSDRAEALLPTMLTDVTLTSDERVLTIDTKYYENALTSHHKSASVRSGHLYQMFAYLKNYAAEHPISRRQRACYSTPSSTRGYDFPTTSLATPFGFALWTSQPRGRTFRENFWV